MAAMGARKRALRPDEKEDRYRAILDAAESLLLRSPGRSANMAEVAGEAGLAKGTVYLYFSSKEELLLALHERSVDAVFRALIAVLDRQPALEADQILSLTRRRLVESPLFLPLAARCIAAMDRSVRAEVATGFQLRMAQRLQRAGARLERRLRGLERGDGARLLRQSFALILGLWQMASVTGASVSDDLDRALRSLWEGSLGRPKYNARTSSP